MSIGQPSLLYLSNASLQFPRGCTWLEYTDVTRSKSAHAYEPTCKKGGAYSLVIQLWMTLQQED